MVKARSESKVLGKVVGRVSTCKAGPQIFARVMTGVTGLHVYLAVLVGRSTNFGLFLCLRFSSSSSFSFSPFSSRLLAYTFVPACFCVCLAFLVSLSLFFERFPAMMAQTGANFKHRFM